MQFAMSVNTSLFSYILCSLFSHFHLFVILCFHCCSFSCTLDQVLVLSLHLGLFSASRQKAYLWVITWKNNGEQVQTLDQTHSCEQLHEKNPGPNIKPMAYWWARTWKNPGPNIRPKVCLWTIEWKKKKGKRKPSVKPSLPVPEYWMWHIVS